MNAKFRLQEVHDSIMESTNMKLVTEIDGKVFTGALFFPLAEYEKLGEWHISTEMHDCKAKDIFVNAYNMLKQYGLVGKEGKTLLTMLHWQFLNGVTDECFTDIHSVETDVEWLKQNGFMQAV